MINTPHDFVFVTLIVLFIVGYLEILFLVDTITNKKDIKYGFIFVYLIFVVSGFFLYNNLKEEIATAFENNQELLCNTSPKVIVSRSLGYVLKNDLFIKDEKIIDIDYCEILKDSFDYY